MSVNLAVGQYYLDQCVNNIPQGMDIETYLKTCFFIYEQNADTCTIRIEDHSELLQVYNGDTDVHEVFINILDENGELCFQGTMSPFGTYSFDLPGCGLYEVQITVQYTIQYEEADDVIVPHTFQIAYIYPVECTRSGDYHNTLLYDIKCRISKTQCEIQKRKCVGRNYCELQENVYALANYLYALCTFQLSVEEFDMISCAVKRIKKVC
jgi:hypothetical protein